MTARRHSEAGYNMVLLLMAVTVLNIMIAAALPYWSTFMQREREEELIFRGLQYAEGIRLFQRRFGRLPVQLQELIEVEPRCMRQLYEDPMTDNGEWGLLFQASGPQGNPNNPNAPNNPNNPNAPPPNGNDGGTEGAPEDLAGGSGPVGLGGDDEDGRTVTVGPIQGVVSRSDEESMLVWNGETQYNRWHFTVSLLTGGAQGNLPIGLPNQNQLSNPSVRWLGRPLPDFIPPGGLQDGNAPGDANQPGRRNLPNTIGGGSAPRPTPRAGEPGPSGGERPN